MNFLRGLAGIQTDANRFQQNLAPQQNNAVINAQMTAKAKTLSEATGFTLLDAHVMLDKVNYNETKAFKLAGQQGPRLGETFAIISEAEANESFEFIEKDELPKVQYSIQTREGKQQWLDSSGGEEWKEYLRGWKGIRFLGQGTFGICGLWRYESETNVPPVKEVVIKQTVVNTGESRYRQSYINKQNIRHAEDSMNEGQTLQILAKAQSIHIIRQYGGFYVDTWRGSQVVRLYLEYCPHGDLSSVTDYERGDKRAEDVLPEVDVWAMFYCLTLALVVMGYGSEDPTKPAWKKNTSMVHFE